MRKETVTQVQEAQGVPYQINLERKIHSFGFLEKDMCIMKSHRMAEASHQGQWVLNRGH